MLLAFNRPASLANFQHQRSATMLGLRFSLVIALAAAACPTMAPTATPAAGGETYRLRGRRLDDTMCVTDIAGYTPITNVDQHAYIDLELAEFLTYIEADDFENAKTICAS